MEQRPIENSIVFEKPEYSVLERAAEELGIELSLPSDIRLAEDLFQQGIPVPGTEGGITPKEMTYVAQLLEAVQEQKTLPPELHVYINDRGIGELPEESVPTAVIRKRKQAFDDLVGAVDAIKSSLEDDSEHIIF